MVVTHSSATDSQSGSPTSTRASPVEPHRRVAVSSLLNSDEATISFTATNAIGKPCRGSSEPVDSPIEMAMEPGTPTSDDEDEVDDRLGGSRALGRGDPSKARLRKKQWTHDQVRKLQELYRADYSWERIGELLGRSPVACKLKHNKELRRKAPMVMPLVGREPMHAAHGPQQILHDAMAAISNNSQQLRDCDAHMTARINEQFASFAWLAEDEGRRTGVDPSATIERVSQTLKWEFSQNIARQQQMLNDVWSALRQYQSQTGMSPQPHVVAVSHHHY